MLAMEITALRESGGGMARFFITHMNTQLEAKIQEELHIVSQSVNAPITLANEGLVIEL